MQGVCTLHACIPKGLARPTILPDPSHRHRARKPPPLGGARRQHTHRAHTTPLAKGLSTRLPSPPATPIGRYNYTLGEGLPRRPGGGQGTPTGGPATPQGKEGAQGGTGWEADAPSLLHQAGHLRAFPAWGPAANATRGAPLPRAGLPKTEQPPAPGNPQLPPSGPPARGRPGWVPQEPMAAAAAAVACADSARRPDSAGGAGRRRRSPGVSPPPAGPGPSGVPPRRACALSTPPGRAGRRARG